jgi:hypothetical protein
MSDTCQTIPCTIEVGRKVKRQMPGKSTFSLPSSEESASRAWRSERRSTSTASAFFFEERLSLAMKKIPDQLTYHFIKKETMNL